ncbi:MAG: hypothetical protein ACPGVU_10120 [Limisphaerales bacterium]
MRILTLCVLVLALRPADLIAADTKPAAHWAEIKLPYDQLQRMWEATQSKPATDTNAPPIAALVKSATYELSTTSNSVTVRAEYEVENFTEQWQSLELLGGDVKLTSVDSTNTTVAWQGDTYTLLIQKGGSHRVQAMFNLPRRAMREGVDFRPGVASVCSLQAFDLPKDQTLEIAGIDSIGADDGVMTWHFPGSGGRYRLRFTEPRPALPPIQPSRWALASETFVTETNGRLHHDCLLHAMATTGSALEMNVTLPVGAAGIVFKGEDGMEGRVSRDSHSQRTLQLRWKTRDLPDRRVELSYSIPIAQRDEWQVFPPQTEEGNTGRASIAFARLGGREVTTAATKIDHSRLSSWLRGKADGNLVHLFESSGPAKFAIKWLPRIQTARAMVSGASYETRLVDDGAMLITGRLTVDHRQPVELSLTMPTFEEVLTGKLNGSSVRPIQRSESVIEFTLPANAMGRSELEFSYAAQGVPFDAISGSLDLQLPKTELFIHDLNWQLDLPDRFETSAIQGNVVFDAKAKKSTHDLHLRKRLVRREHPSVQIHYRRRGLDD